MASKRGILAAILAPDIAPALDADGGIISAHLYPILREIGRIQGP